MADVPQEVWDDIMADTHRLKDELRRILTGEVYDKIEDLIDVYENALQQAWEGRT